MNLDNNSRKNTFIHVLNISLIIIIALVIGLYRLDDSGMQWAEDGARYLNNAAMIYEYLTSEQKIHPIDFAFQNYADFPAHSLPYHPPGYATLLASWFFIFGISFESARVFIAIFIGISAVTLYLILKNQGVSKTYSTFGALVFVTTYEVAKWGRSTMAEIPAMAFILIGSYFFLRWTEKRKWQLCCVSFLFASLGFFCRINSVGIIPAWIIYFVFKGKKRAKDIIVLVACSTISLICWAGWAKFASGYAQHEVRRGVDVGSRISGLLDLQQHSMLLAELTNLASPLLLAIFFASLIIVFRKNISLGYFFWCCWFVLYYFFSLIIFNHFETRYLIYLIPSIVGIVSISLNILLINNKTKLIAFFITALIIFSNLYLLTTINLGVTGYDDVAEKLSSLNKKGNVLLSSWNDAYFMFFYRSLEPEIHRRMIRADRTISIRLPVYSEGKDEILIEDKDEFIDIIKKGRIRYILTAGDKIFLDGSTAHIRPHDMFFTHNVVTNDKDQFKLIDRFTIDYYFDNTARVNLYLWEYNGELQKGKSELKVYIPTANIYL